jgi:levanase/fructan beta-fructosidase
MSWGHATTTDFVHWKHLPVAIPEIVTKDTTTWIYSGSAVLDKDNTSGFGKNGKPPVVAIFTADQPKQHKESQFIAYSNDGGMSYTQYAKNPVIDLNKSDFRDPNVWWHEGSKQWIMTVAMVDEHMVRIYGSKNLKEWTKLSDFGPAGYTRNGWECPFMVPLAVDGDKSKIKWMLSVSSGGDHGPLMQYFVGDFDGTTFKSDNPTGTVFSIDNGDTFYAGIPWRAKGESTLLGWLQNGRPETFPWKGQMSIPRDLSLRTTADGVRLFQQPSGVIQNSLNKLSKSHAEITKKTIGDDLKLPQAGNSNSYWIEAEFSLNDAKQAGFKIAQSTDGQKAITLGYDAAKQQLFIDCSSAEKDNKSKENLIQTTELKITGGTVKLQLLVDRSSVELFGNNGEKVISTMIYPDITATGVSAFGAGAKITRLKVWDMGK